MDKEELNELAWKAWEIDQQTNPNPVNPHAFVYGFKIGFRNKDQELSLLTERNKHLMKQFEMSVIDNSELTKKHDVLTEKYNRLKEDYDNLKARHQR